MHRFLQVLVLKVLDLGITKYDVSFFKESLKIFELAGLV